MASHHVVGTRWREKIETINPENVRFTIDKARSHGSCDGCVFSGQPSTVCRKASEIAKANGILDCDEPLPDGSSGIYVIDLSDPRQMQIPLVDM